MGVPLNGGAAAAARGGGELEEVNPEASQVHPPFARYSHGVMVPPGAHLVFASGQLGIDPEGEVPADVREQAALCFENALQIVKEAGMGRDDIVRINAYVTSPNYLKPYMQVRDEYIGERPPASTLMIVTGFASPSFKVEVELVAAKVKG